MLWWRWKESEIGMELCTIVTLEKFQVEYTMAFFPNNVIYLEKYKFRELKKTRSIKTYMKLFTIINIQFPNHIDEDAFVHCMDGL